MKWILILALGFLAASLGACDFPSNEDLPTLLPAEQLPTVIAATMAAYATETANELPAENTSLDPYSTIPSAELQQAGNLQPTGQEAAETADAATPEATDLSSGTPSSVEATIPSGQVSAGELPVGTPFPELPIAGIQIFKPGDMSKVASPIEVSGYLRPGARGRVTIELFGEDGRLLVRQIRVYDVTPGARVNLAEDVPFQISAAAEVGRLVLSMADEAGRTIALNSIDLILLSMGDSDINPSVALQEFIYIREPKLKNLVQGGSVLVSGLARPFTDQPLVVHLIAEDGRVVGQRVVGVSERAANGYGEFAVEVAYTVDELTPVRLTVYEIGMPVSPIRYLSSLEIVLGP
ncbi:MAG TPA: hypothetical protein VN363_09120 [Anaerolineales bacterium]|nr:hypothetical protein [Anaerolineales bacterium]